MKLYIIRHGETNWNVEGRLQGRADIPLNEKGRQLAETTAKALAEVPFTKIYTSPLQRAKETAMIIKGQRQIPVIEEERLQEICFGIYEGYHCSKEKYDIPDPEFLNFFDKPEAYCPPEGAESIEELCARTTDFLQELVHTIPKDSEQTILLSTHGAALMGLLSSLRKDSEEKGFWHGGVHKNCAVTVVEVSADTISIVEEGKIYY